MQRTRLRPGTTRVAIVAWGAQSVVAVLWLLSSIIDNGSWWVWPFGIAWALFGLGAAYRSYRQAVVVDEEGMQLLTGLSHTATIPWGMIRDVSAEPPGEFVSRLAVVLNDTRVVETPLGKGDERLRELWLSRRAA